MLSNEADSKRSLNKSRACAAALKQDHEAEYKVELHESVRAFYSPDQEA
jgi:hypothetical protein